MCMIATTIISSINVNPKLMRFIPPSYSCSVLPRFRTPIRVCKQINTTVI